ncbi:MAG: helix-turn-helix transcriptional regulator [Terriglobia bacterium]|nr:helix-turn-helix transcriptional regulator [Terriglobia bacterium]
MCDEKVNNSLIAGKIREVRLSLGLSQIIFAKDLRVDQTTVSKWEGGKARPTPEALMRIAGMVQGEDRIFFLKEGGVPFDDEGTVDLALKPQIPEARRHGIILASQNNQTERTGRMHRPGAIYSWNPDVLAFVIETLNREMRKRKKGLPDPKYAQAVILAYEHCDGQRDRVSESVRSVLRLVR